MQSRLNSLIEQLWQQALGFVLAVLVQQFVINPLWGLHTTVFDNIGIVTVFTIVSIGRGYGVRRYFNWLENKKKKAANGNTQSGDHH